MQKSYPQFQQLSRRLQLSSTPSCFRVITDETSASHLHRALLSSILLHSPTHLSVFILDAGNVFEGLFLSRLAKVIGARARKVFQRMMISRTFTAYQTENAMLSLRRTLAPERTLFVGLHPLATFYDEQLPFADAERKIERIGRSLADARQMGFRLLFTLPPSDHHVGRSHFARLFSRYAEEVISLSSIEHLSLTTRCDFKNLMRCEVSQKNLRPNRRLTYGERTNFSRNEPGGSKKQTSGFARRLFFRQIANF